MAVIDTRFRHMLNKRHNIAYVVTLRWRVFICLQAYMLRLCTCVGVCLFVCGCACLCARLNIGLLINVTFLHACSNLYDLVRTCSYASNNLLYCILTCVHVFVNTFWCICGFVNMFVVSIGLSS